MSATWDLVGGNPAPGDPDAVRSHASALSYLESDTRSFVDSLTGANRQISSDIWKGEAADRFRTIASGLTPGILSIASAVDHVVGVLLNYASALEQLQQEAHGLLQQAAEASADESSANGQIGALTQQIDEGSSQYDGLVEQLNEVDRELATRRSQPGVVPTTDVLVQRYEQESTQLRTSLADVERQIAGYTQSLESARGNASEAAGRLSRARSQINSIQEQFASLARSTTISIENEGGGFAHSKASFASRAIHGIDGLWSRGKKDVDRAFAAAEHQIVGTLDSDLKVVGAAAAVAGGLAKEIGKDGLHDVEVAAVVAAPIVHAVAQQVARFSGDLARITADSSTVLEVAGIAVAVVGVVGVLTLQPELAVPALAAGDALLDGSKALGGASLALDGVQTEATSAEVGSDLVMDAAGNGNIAQTRLDEHDAVVSAVNTGEGVADLGLSKIPGVPDPDSILQDPEVVGVEKSVAGFTVEHVVDVVEGDVNAHAGAE